MEGSDGPKRLGTLCQEKEREEGKRKREERKERQKEEVNNSKSSVTIMQCIPYFSIMFPACHSWYGVVKFTELRC